ncbi:MAG: restriction endonuclease, partial [Polyangiaceae bacterium]|nr:restriction endonuclease [Polyangiaceae bacterium]
LWSAGDRRAAERVRAVADAVDDLRHLTKKSLIDQLSRMPQKAFGEMMMVLLERLGVSEIEVVRRQGAHGSELHLSGSLRLAGLDPVSGGALTTRTAIIIRRDGKDIGRERVNDLRGALHHYGGASHGWLLSAGQVLSGAREEAAASAASTVTLTGRHELAELCLAHGIGVRVHRLEVPVVDAELFEQFSSR